MTLEPPLARPGALRVFAGGLEGRWPLARGFSAVGRLAVGRSVWPLAGWFFGRWPLAAGRYFGFSRRVGTATIGLSGQ